MIDLKFIREVTSKWVASQNRFHMEGDIADRIVFFPDLKCKEALQVKSCFCREHTGLRILELPMGCN